MTVFFFHLVNFEISFIINEKEATVTKFKLALLTAVQANELER